MSILSPSLFNLYAQFIMRNAGLDGAQVGIKISGRNINNLRYADSTTLMAESEEELKSLLMKVKEESEKVGFKLNIQKNKIMAPFSAIMTFFLQMTPKFPKVNVSPPCSLLALQTDPFSCLLYTLSPSFLVFLLRLFCHLRVILAGKTQSSFTAFLSSLSYAFHFFQLVASPRLSLSFLIWRNEIAL